MITLRHASLCALLALAGCDETASASPVDASAPDAAPPAKSARPSASQAPPEKVSLQVLKFAFTTEVKNKEPVDKLEAAAPGQRIYAHLTIRNRTGSAQPISLVFLVNGEQRSKVDLKVESSWSFRTWAYNTLRASDLTGALTLELRDESGLLATYKLPIKSDAPKGPPGKPMPLDPHD